MRTMAMELRPRPSHSIAINEPNADESSSQELVASAGDAFMLASVHAVGDEIFPGTGIERLHASLQQS